MRLKTFSRHDRDEFGQPNLMSAIFIDERNHLAIENGSVSQIAKAVVKVAILVFTEQLDWGKSEWERIPVSAQFLEQLPKIPPFTL